MKTKQITAATFQNAKTTAEFNTAFRSLCVLSDARVKQIAKKLWGRPSSNRQAAYDNIRAWWNREALVISSFAALDSCPL